VSLEWPTSNAADIISVASNTTQLGPSNSSGTGYGNTTTGGNSTKPGGNSTTTPGGKCTIPSGVLAHAKDRETQVMVLQQAVVIPLEYSHHRISLCTPKVRSQAFFSYYLARWPGKPLGWDKGENVALKPVPAAVTPWPRAKDLLPINRLLLSFWVTSEETTPGKSGGTRVSSCLVYARCGRRCLTV